MKPFIQPCATPADIKSQHFDGAAWIETLSMPLACMAASVSQHFDGAAWIETSGTTERFGESPSGRSTSTVLRGLKPDRRNPVRARPRCRSTSTVLRGLKQGTLWPPVSASSESRSTSTVLRGLKLDAGHPHRPAGDRRSTSTVLRGLKRTGSAGASERNPESQHFDGAAWIEAGSCATAAWLALSSQHFDGAAWIETSTLE